MFQNVEGLSVILCEVTRTTREIPECRDSRADGITWYVLVGVNTTKPTDGVDHVKVKEEEESCEAICSSR